MKPKCNQTNNVRSYFVKGFKEVYSIVYCKNCFKYNFALISYSVGIDTILIRRIKSARNLLVRHLAVATKAPPSYYGTRQLIRSNLPNVRVKSIKTYIKSAVITNWLIKRHERFDMSVPEGNRYLFNIFIFWTCSEWNINDGVDLFASL